MPVPAGPGSSTGGVCTPWVDAATVSARPDMTDVTVDSDVLDAACLDASILLYGLSGRQFPGECTATVRPHGGHYGCRHPSHLAAWSAVDSITAATNGWGGPCGDGGIDLGLYPVRSVTTVKVNGATLASSAYRVDDQRWLVVRIGLGFWPLDQDLNQPDTAANTFSVALTHGADPPPPGVSAASTLSAELAKARSGLPNNLPRRITNLTRQQVSVTVADPSVYLDKGLTGIYDVDLFLRTYNPHGQRARPLVWSPETQRRRRVG